MDFMLEMFGIFEILVV